MNELHETVTKLLAPHKGLLAADESTKSASVRFQTLGIPCTDETRRQYRQMLITTPGIEAYLSGVIFYDETIRQSTDDGTPFPQYLESKGIVPGIKVDKGLVPLDNFDGETITEGLDGLGDRLSEYYKLGARFAKWRAAFTVNENQPSQAALHANLHTMARYASLCQSHNIVPIVEPEILYDGPQSLERAHAATSAALQLLVQMLKAYRVDLSGCILKTSMVLAGKQSGEASSPQEVAEHTLAVLNEAIPQEMAGVVFLSGGQTPEQARDNLQAIGAQGKQPWPITFSYSRAVQDPAMKAWAGKLENISKAQAIYSQLTHNVSLARHGEYQTQQNPELGEDSSFVSQSQDS